MIRGEFPDISVSKLRYLEAEGLISPDRQQPSGYRRFSQEDIDRLLYVLRAQRDRYLPLKVIREELEALDRGEDPTTVVHESDERAEAGPAPSRPHTRSAPNGSQLLSRRQLLQESGLGEASLIHLERMRLIEPRRGTAFYGREAVAVAVTAKRLSHYGVDLRQMKVLLQAASAEAAFVEQVLEPFRRRGSAPNEIVVDVYRVVLQAHAALLHGQING
ncbi:MerR family transcriptional regulator [uncultured Tessaracoccus sp.]|uniref:transcriptional regulator FtsR n=1 Tax=uncultured Tessaracoccus sp. TaxID=905023 RepID=UPI00345D2EA0